jgi:hypothetical protein
MWRLIYAIPSWILFECISIPLMLLGWIVVPVAAICGAYVKTDDNLAKPNDGPIYHFTWKWMYIWDNWEDGIANQNYKKFDSMFMRIVYWSCLRNPTNNLRTVPYISCKIDMEGIGFFGSFWDYEPDDRATELQLHAPFIEAVKKYDTKIPQWFFAWQGLYSNFYWQFMLNGKLRRFWIGWKIYPADIFGGDLGYRKHGAGFALQWKVVKT